MMPGRKSEVDDFGVQLFFTIIKLTRKSSSTPLKVLWRWGSNEAAGADTLEAVDANPHTGSSGHVVAVY